METMNIAELGTIEIIETAADNEELTFNLDAVVDAVIEEDASITDNLESQDRDGDGMAAARPSGYNKTEYDDAVGAFFKEMARYPLLKPDEEVELARRVRFLEEFRELQASLSNQLEYQAGKSIVASHLGMTEKQLENRLYQGRVAKRSRGTLGYPFLVGEIDYFLKTGELLAPPTPIERLECAREHLQALYEYKGIRGVRQARKHMTWYAKGFAGAADLRGQLSVIESVEQGVDLIDRAIEQLTHGYEPEEAVETHFSLA
ncbi:hypothetical protein NUACC21_29150 [Scytonema sp. NUACC21]